MIDGIIELIGNLIVYLLRLLYKKWILYNGGFNAGLTAIILIPILDFYKIEPKKVDSDELFE